jgi:hypothetical protein
MKKILLIMALAFTVSVANAWNNLADEGVVVLASKYLTPETKALVDQYLGDSYVDDIQYLYNLERKKTAKHTKEIHCLHLDKNFRPVAVEGDDAYAAIEKSMAVIAAHSSHSKKEVVVALRTLINLMCDIHNLSFVRIEGVDHSYADFKFTLYAGDYGKRKTTLTARWFTFWNSYPGLHAGFSGALWAEDLELNLGHRRAEFSEGNLVDWIAQNGEISAKLLARINPQYEMTRRERNELEVLNCEMIARAGYRLAVLLNGALK